MIVRPLGREGDRIRPALLVLGHRRVPFHRLGAAPVDIGELGVGEGLGDLAHAVGAEIEREHRVARSDARRLTDDDRAHELVGLVALVGVAHRLGAGVGAMLGAPVHEQVIGTLHAIPALVAVHGEIASDD